MPKKKPGTMTVTMTGIPTAQWRAFKAWCMLRGISAKAKIVSLIRETITRGGDKK
jgi:hypothetical protein